MKRQIEPATKQRDHRENLKQSFYRIIETVALVSYRETCKLSDRYWSGFHFTAGGSFRSAVNLLYLHRNNYCGRKFLFVGSCLFFYAFFKIKLMLFHKVRKRFCAISGKCRRRLNTEHHFGNNPLKC